VAPQFVAVGLSVAGHDEARRVGSLGHQSIVARPDENNTSRSVDNQLHYSQ
jgi:hypothetical protein